MNGRIVERADRQMNRWTNTRMMTDVPARTGAARADETPGTMSQGMPALAKALSSLPTLEKVEGQPPFSLTTSLPCHWATAQRLEGT